MSLTVVWFKRDLRIADHAPLYHAAQKGLVIPVYVIEPEYWKQPDTSLRQWEFVRETLLELDKRLSLLGQALWVAQGNIETCLQSLFDEFGKFQLFSHQEFGNQWTRQRNQRVAHWCLDRDINWIQFQPCGVVKGLASREQWPQQWQQYMAQPTFAAPAMLKFVATTPIRPELWPEALGFNQIPCLLKQAGGRTAGLNELSSFLKGRGLNYQKDLLSPNASFTGSSRLSPYLSCGALSLREVVGQVMRAKKHYTQKGHKRWVSSIKAWLQRLQWHCHYLQQFNDEPVMEIQPLHKSYVGLREDAFNERLFRAWATGTTGFPLIDAAMRSLQKYGWINARLRSLLVSFASYQLWLHWREPALHLAQLFTDYEPGIHYAQIQAVAGTKGMRHWHIFDPVKQSRLIDPDGSFIKYECPELRELNEQYIHSPWLMSQSEQVMNSCVLGEDYPLPIVDPLLEARRAQDKIRSYLLENYDPQETERLIHKHGTAAMRRQFKENNSSTKQMDVENHLLPYAEED